MKKFLKLDIQTFATGTTTMEKMIDPEVMAPMISAKIEEAIVATPFAKIDTTLAGRAGDTITVPKYQYIGDAEDLAEGVTADKTLLTTTSANYKVKKAVKQVELTDEAVLSGYGNPVGETNSQLAKSIASKVDNDVMEALKGAQLTYNGAQAGISYDEVVNAIDVLNEEENVEKVMFIHPKQVSQLRKDTNFISNDKYPNNVIMKGEIGMIANAHIVPSKKAVNDAKTYFLNPIVELKPESQTGDETAAVTIFLKRDTNVETQRELGNYTTLIGADKHYVAALTDESKVVVAKFPVGNISL
jgi:N4-gp56 family major capsid protein